MDREVMFSKIKSAYEEREKELKEKGIMIDRPTSKGTFSPSDIDEVFGFFKKIGLSRYRNFIDLGSGDGRVALIASLFTRAAGVEEDLALLRVSERMRDKLALNAEFIHGDYMQHDLSDYDIIYWYPDDGKRERVEKKLVKEMKGDLIIYRMIYTPKSLAEKFSEGSFMIFGNQKSQKINI